MIQVSAAEANEELQRENHSVFLDVRTTQEFAAAHINGAINIPLDAVEENIEKAVPDFTVPIYVYCLSGSRSIQAAMILQNLGYKNVFDVRSGLLAWRINKFPLVS